MEKNSTERQIQALQDARLPSWGQINPARMRFVQQYAGKSILDVGCSIGSYVNFLNAKGYKAFGIDLLADPNWFEWLPTVKSVGSINAIPFSDLAFDTLLAFELLEHIHNLDNALAEIYRVTRNNIIVSVPDCILPTEMLKAGLIYAHWRDRTHTNFFTEESLVTLLEMNGFKVHHLSHINPVRLDLLSLRSFHLPVKLAGILSEGLRRLPLRKQYYMTLLVVATKVY